MPGNGQYFMKIWIYRKYELEKKRYWWGLKCCERPRSPLCPGTDLSHFLPFTPHIPRGLIGYLDDCSHCFLSACPPRAHARPTTPPSGGHPVHTGDHPLGAAGLQRDPLPQLQPHGAAPLQGGRQGADPGGGVLRHPEPGPSAHHPQLDAIYQPECQAGPT